MSAAVAALVCAPHQDGVPACLGGSSVVPQGAPGPARGFTSVPSSQGAALGCMVGLMSYGKRQFEELDPIMRKLIPRFHQAMDELVAMVDADSRAFSSYMVRSHWWQTSCGGVGAFPAGKGLALLCPSILRNRSVALVQARARERDIVT